ncbi:phosphoglycerate mutase family protein [Pollutibacter soli]|uniref:phosphoglycerate mutase family protein n=1 Tax=Pollutibacter soli TaxID=3034157 RepID=UPI0030133E2E
MKKLLCIALVYSVLISCTSSTKIYFVRHAEKGTGSQDPDLTPEGKERAQQLASYLRKKKIKAIYSTQTKRTVQTAEPTSAMEKIPIQYYRNDTAQKFLYHVLERGKNTLIVGHSNTTINMLKELSLDPTIKEIPDDDYDNIFIVTLKSRSGPSGFHLRLKESTYGAKSPPANTEGKKTSTMSSTQ